MNIYLREELARAREEVREEKAKNEGLKKEANDVREEMKDSVQYFEAKVIKLVRRIEMKNNQLQKKQETIREMRGIVDRWGNTQSAEIETVMTRLRTAEDEILSANREWKKLFFESMKLRTGDLAKEDEQNNKRAREEEEQAEAEEDDVSSFVV